MITERFLFLHTFLHTKMEFILLPFSEFIVTNSNIKYPYNISGNVSHKIICSRPAPATFQFN
jgi:hypothetical protein